MLAFRSAKVAFFLSFAHQQPTLIPRTMLSREPSHRYTLILKARS
jgi:hypothetical protein